MMMMGVGRNPLIMPGTSMPIIYSYKIDNKICAIFEQKSEFILNHIFHIFRNSCVSPNDTFFWAFVISVFFSLLYGL